MASSVVMEFFITIDTEEDEWGTYRPGGYSVGNIGRIPRLQELFERHGAVPTYLLSYPVATSEIAQEVFGQFTGGGRCEVGTHCHPWNTPPFEEECNERNSMLLNLPEDLVARKIESLHAVIAKNFGVEPRCFRAGRWGFGSKVAAAIARLSYRVDTSVTPHVDWSIYCGPDFRRAPEGMYVFDPDEVMTPRRDGILMEVPATVGFLQRDRDRCGRLLDAISTGPLARLRVRGMLDRAGLLNLRWLSPELSDGREMVALVRASLARGCSHLNMSFHSTALLPGSSPFVRTESDLHSFLRNIERVLEFARSEGCVFSPLSGVVRQSSGAEERL